MTPLKRDWPKIYSPLVDECGLMVRMNVNRKSIEMKVSDRPQPAPQVQARMAWTRGRKVPSEDGVDEGPEGPERGLQHCAEKCRRGLHRRVAEGRE